MIQALNIFPQGRETNADGEKMVLCFVFCLAPENIEEAEFGRGGGVWGRNWWVRNGWWEPPRSLG